jgi:hypothetical protein
MSPRALNRLELLSVLVVVRHHRLPVPGLSPAQIAARLRDPSSPVAQAIDGSAQVIIAAINQALRTQGASS